MLQAYSIFDKKAASFDRPFFCKHVADATRSVQAALESPKEQQPWFAKYPADFALYFVGTFDPTTGQWMPPSNGAASYTIEVASLVPVLSDFKGGMS